MSFRAYLKLDGSGPADIRVPQPMDLALCRACAHLSGIQGAVLRAIVYRQYQFGPDRAAAQEIWLDELIELLKVDRSSVLRAALRLEKLGLIDVAHRKGRGHINTYALSEKLLSAALAFAPVKGGVDATYSGREKVAQPPPFAPAKGGVDAEKRWRDGSEKVAVLPVKGGMPEFNEVTHQTRQALSQAPQARAREGEPQTKVAKQPTEKEQTTAFVDHYSLHEGCPGRWSCGQFRKELEGQITASAKPNGSPAAGVEVKGLVVEDDVIADLVPLEPDAIWTTHLHKALIRHSGHAVNYPSFTEGLERLLEAGRLIGTKARRGGAVGTKWSRRSEVVP